MVKVLKDEIAVNCYHCGTVCEDKNHQLDEKQFCCSGCKTVFEILQENNLCTYYDLNQNAGVSLKAKDFSGKYDFLDSLEIQNQILDFKSEHLAKVTFYIPAVHCSSCVWLLENFNKVKAGVITARLNFIRKELFISFDPAETSLKEIVELLATLGYAPLINLDTANKASKPQSEQHKLLLRLGVVGFCFGNIMLLSFPEYFKLDLQNAVDAGYQKFFLYLNFLLALPVYFYGGSDYIKGAYVSIRENIKGTTRVLSVDIPIMMGITALFVRSTYETFVNQSSGYWDSLAGLVFFLLIGKWLQQVTYKYLSFERDYKSYFPLAVKVKEQGFKNVADLKRSETIEIHHQELISADSILLSSEALIDYSFVTGESVPVEIKQGERIFAGGRQLGGKVELLVEKTVSQSYLTELWNNEAFNKEKASKTSNFANIFSKYFTYVAIGIAVITGVYWHFNNPDLVWPSVTAVLMVACPCALTLAMPFTMNAAMSIFGKNKFYVKNQNVIQLLTEVNTIAFDKTGTLTEGKGAQVSFTEGKLTEREELLVASLVSQSVHPLSKLIAEYLNKDLQDISVQGFTEVKGGGLYGIVDGREVKVGSSEFLNLKDVKKNSGEVLVVIDKVYKGRFVVKSNFRPGWKGVLEELGAFYDLALISGDNDRDRSLLNPYFTNNKLLFNQKPQDKLEFIKAAQSNGQKVLMLGDGLNDAGALKQSHIGVALTEDVNAFSPACDVILDSGEFKRIGVFLGFSKIAMNVVIAGFALSILYNIIGIGLASTGNLSPLYAAVFMPLSSMSVVAFSVGCTYLFARIKNLI